VPKKEKLEKIVRGNGIDAFRPSTEYSSLDEKEENHLDSTLQPVSAEKEDTEKMIHEEKKSGDLAEEKSLNESCIIKEFLPTEEQLAEIMNKFGDNPHQILIWDTFISQNGKSGLVFKNDVPLSLNVCCAVSGVIEKLQPDFEVQWLTYDVERMQSQPIYEFKIITQPFWPVFILTYKINSTTKGIFNFRVILDVEKIESFYVEEGFSFKIY
jgi:hypothetical protein